MLKNKYRLAVLLGIACAVLLLANLSSARAETPIPTGLTGSVQCGRDDIPSYQALVGVGADTYDTYVRLGLPGQTSPATLYFQSLQTGACQKVGSITVTGDAWANIGAWTAAPNTAGNFILQAGADGNAPSANRPTIMLVSHSHPVCQPTTECAVNVNSQQGVVRATGTLLNEDTLHVVVAVDPAADTLQNVSYYVDDRPVYATKSLQDFDLRYVGIGTHTLTRVATYKSGQSIIFTNKLDHGTGNFNALFVSIIYGQSVLLKIILALCIVTVFVWAVLGLLRLIHKRRSWKQSHFAGFAAKKTPTPAQAISPSPVKIQQPHFILPDSLPKQIAKRTALILSILVTAFVVVALLNTFVMQIYQVDGPSMQTTLYNGQHLAVNRLGQTWAQISRKKYVPKRGNIIIFKKAQSTLLTLDTKQEQTYVVKRVIGLPGERIVVDHGIVTVYNDQSPQGFNVDLGHPWTKNVQPTPQDEQVDVRLGPDELFVSGDNRPESVDSRAYGPIKVDSVIGQVILRLPPDFRTF